MNSDSLTPGQVQVGSVSLPLVLWMCPETMAQVSSETREHWTAERNAKSQRVFSNSTSFEMPSNSDSKLAEVIDARGVDEISHRVL
jgi:hypothetical protein